MIYRVIAAFSAVGLALVFLLFFAVKALAPHLRLWPWIAAGLLADAVLLYGMLERNAPLFGRIVHRGSGSRPLIALTFDDGPTEPYTSQILDILDRYGVKATFFVLGVRIARARAAVERAAATGHELANHGWDHSVLPLRGPGFARQQIRMTTDAIAAAAGVRPRWFRPPRGWRNPWTSPAARGEGCGCVGWTVGVYDTAHPGAQAIIERSVAALSNGCILLLHDGRDVESAPDCHEVVEALPAIIEAGQRRGFRFVTLSELVGAGDRG